MEELFVIRSVDENRYFIQENKGSRQWSSDIKDATTYTSYSEVSERLSTDDDIPEGMYQIEKFFKKPEVDYSQE